MVLAPGSVFSALEVVPLLFVGYEAWENYKLSRVKDWIAKYKWPIARSAEFMQTKTMEILRWLGVIGDTIFVFSSFLLAASVIEITMKLLKDKATTIKTEHYSEVKLKYAD